MLWQVTKSRDKQHYCSIDRRKQCIKVRSNVEAVSVAKSQILAVLSAEALRSFLPSPLHDNCNKIRKNSWFKDCKGILLILSVYEFHPLPADSQRMMASQKLCLLALTYLEWFYLLPSQNKSVSSQFKFVFAV